MCSSERGLYDTPVIAWRTRSGAKHPPPSSTTHHAAPSPLSLYSSAPPHYGPGPVTGDRWHSERLRPHIKGGQHAQTTLRSKWMYPLSTHMTFVTNTFKKSTVSRLYRWCRQWPAEQRIGLIVRSLSNNHLAYGCHGPQCVPEYCNSQFVYAVPFSLSGARPACLLLANRELRIWKSTKSSNNRQIAQNWWSYIRCVCMCGLTIIIY